MGIIIDKSLAAASLPLDHHFRVNSLWVMDRWVVTAQTPPTHPVIIAQVDAKQPAPCVREYLLE